MWRDNMFQAGKSEYLWSSGALHKIEKKIYRLKYSSVLIYYFNIGFMMKYQPHREIVNIITNIILINKDSGSYLQCHIAY